jgi:hypothetical protein
MSKGKNLKRKRENDVKSFICRQNLCTNLHYNINEAFCEKHRSNFTRNSTQLFFSTKNDLIIPEDIIVQILYYNIPFIYRLENAIDVFSNRILLKKGDIKAIFDYFQQVNLITKQIQNIFTESIKILYRNIYILDGSIQRINIKSSTYSHCNILDLYDESPSKFLNNNINDIIEYYRNKMISKRTADKAINLKNKINSIILDQRPVINERKVINLPNIPNSVFFRNVKML